MTRNPLQFSPEQLAAIHNQAIPLLDEAQMDDYMQYERNIRASVMWGGNDKKQTTKTEVI